jgi:transposase-like protein
MAGFGQATIKVEREKEFRELKGAIDRAFASTIVEQFLQQVSRRGLRIRDWDSVLSRRVLEAVNETLNRSGKSAQQLYQELTVPDKAQIREFYLFRVEEVDPKVRTKFHKIYQYY